jgi:hypothetical protein
VEGHPSSVTTNGVYGGPKLGDGVRNCATTWSWASKSCPAGSAAVGLQSQGWGELPSPVEPPRGGSQQGWAGRTALAVNGMELGASNRRVGKASTSGALVAVPGWPSQVRRGVANPVARKRILGSNPSPGAILSQKVDVIGDWNADG